VVGADLGEDDGSFDCHFDCFDGSAVGVEVLDCVCRVFLPRCLFGSVPGFDLQGVPPYTTTKGGWSFLSPDFRRVL